MKCLNNLIIYSYWPITLTINLNLMMLNLIINNNKILLTLIHLIMIFLNLMEWILLNYTEEMILGIKSSLNNLSIKISTSLVITTEMMFFSSFFYINFSMLFFNNFMFNFKFFLSMFKLNFILSFTNLVILLTSSMLFMLFIKNNLINKIKSTNLLNLSLTLGLYFVFIQLMEYNFMSFNLSNSVFFSNFFTLTLFHMIHVIMGIIMMMNLINIKHLYLWTNKMKIKSICWYWHFIDLVWILIFILIYLYFNNMMINMFNFQLKNNI